MWSGMATTGELAEELSKAEAGAVKVRRMTDGRIGCLQHVFATGTFTVIWDPWEIEALKEDQAINFEILKPEQEL